MATIGRLAPCELSSFSASIGGPARCCALTVVSGAAGAQLHELYQLHMRNTNLPAEFSTLLQLREMLDIDNGVAEALEQEVLQAGGSFSI